MPLKPDVKAKWLAALRSGEYTQGQRVLPGHTFAQTADYIEEQL